MINGYIALTKPRIISLLLITALGGLFLASEGFPDPITTLVVLVGGSLAAGGANAINHFLDRDIDSKMSRTSQRPLVSGQITPIPALLFGISLNILAFALLWQMANLLSALLALTATLFYVFVYTIALKRTTPQNIVIGGAAGAIPPMVGWAAVTGNILDPSPFLLFAIIFFWTPPHFWALSLILKDDYEEAGVPMLPVVAGVHSTKKQIFAYTWVLLVLMIATVLLAPGLGVIYGVISLSLTFIFIGFTWRLLKQDGIGFAKATYLFSLAYLAILFLAIIIEGSLQ
ncbi:MAG: protoheme IX farnesyltransferase [SAR202 cluster bacterium]|nr:protoheme IX farnesyltransferase [SAR202 cluster bacterium]|tara:strand:- start:1225 stop:2085 length:861 start_codon:yes stop_codon:yes gene_type:complete